MYVLLKYRKRRQKKKICNQIVERKRGKEKNKHKMKKLERKKDGNWKGEELIVEDRKKSFPLVTYFVYLGGFH